MNTELKPNKSKVIDNEVIRQDWNTIKDWILSAESKQFRMISFGIIFFIFLLLSIPSILQIGNSDLKNVIRFITLSSISPLIMIIIPIFSYIIMNMMLSVVWIEEKDTITRFQSFSKKQISIFGRSRILIPLLVAIVVEMSLLFVLFTFLSFYSESLLKLPLESPRTYYYLIGVVMFNLFSTLFMTWNLISHGNYLKSILPEIPKMKTTIISEEMFHQIKGLRKSYFDDTGFYLNQFIITFTGLLYFLPFSLITIIPLINNLSTALSSLITNSSLVLGFWILLINFNFLFMSLILWRIIPSKLQTIPKSRYTISEEMKKSLQ